MAKRLVFLQLAPEFGSTKFGPFAAAEIRLGSDPGRNDITLPEALGVAPEHARLVKQPDESFILAPVERTANVYVHRADGRPPKQVTAPVAVVGNDGFSLVSPEGPRFIIVLEFPKQAANDPQSKDHFSKAKGKLSKRSFMEEVKRQGLTRALTTGIGQQIQAGWTFVKSGAIFQPRYIILGVTIMAGWALAGAGACTVSGLAYQNNAMSQDLDDCKGDLSAAVGGGDDMTLSDVVVKLLGDTDWSRVLAEDPMLREMYVQRLRVVRANADKYSWVHKRTNSPYTDFRKRLESSNLPPNLVRVVSYMAALEGFNRDRQWEYVVNSSAGESCGRGPLLLTWRQGKNLKFDPLQLDAAIDATTASQGNIGDLVAALQKTAGEPVTIDEGTINREEGTVQGGGQCVFVQGDDQRADINELARALKQEIGPTASGLPREGDSYWIVMRLLKMYAADFERGYEDVKFDQGNLVPSVALDSVSSLTDDRKKYALQNTADVMARATLLPCLAMMDKQTQKKAEEIEKDIPKSKLTCGMLLFMIEENATE
jgi:hypothetical protein